MEPQIITQIEESRRGGRHAFVLTFNTHDRFSYLEKNIPPTNLIYGLACYFSKEYEIGYYSKTVGIKPINIERKKTIFDNCNLKLLSDLTPIIRTKHEQKRLIFVDYADLLAPSCDNMIMSEDNKITLETLSRWGFDDQVKLSGNLIFLILYTGEVHSLIQHFYTTISVPLPNLLDRKEFIEYLVSLNKFAHIDDSLNINELARITNGLRFIDIEYIFRENNTISREDVSRTKRNAIKDMAGDIMEIIEPLHGFDAISNLDNVKEYFNFLKHQWEHDSQTMPYGIILAGIPGTGKSYIANSLAKELAIPLLTVRNLFNKYVGESEANLERLLKIIESLQPCLVLIEEIDQAGFGSNAEVHDGGITNRISQRLLEYLGNSKKNRSRILWIATSNYPDQLTPAMLDRFQILIPYLQPTEKEISILLPNLAIQLNRKFEENISFNTVSKDIKLPTIRNLTEIVSFSAQLADVRTDSIGADISFEDLKRSVSDFKISYNSIQYEYIALKTISLVSLSSLLPWMSFKTGELRANAEIPSYLCAFVNQEGKIKENELYERLQVLEKELYRSR